MGKPFNSELITINKTLAWVNSSNVNDLRAFLCKSPEIPLLCIGSGGSFSACHFASLLYKEFCNIAAPVTPLGLYSYNTQILCNSKLLYISASGHNKDILVALKHGLEHNGIATASLCTTDNNKINEVVNNKNHYCFHYSAPTQKDGFLATNSLVAFLGLLYKVFYPNIDLSKSLCFDENFAYEYKSERDLLNIQNFIVLFGKYGEPVAYDIESKLSEAALGAVLLSDYRNFGHGRHHWFDKRGDNSCIIAIVTDLDKDLAAKTIENLPNDIPVIYIRSVLSGPLATIELLIKSFYFVRDLGIKRGIDPGRPGVPEYGSKLYNLNYIKLLHNLKKKYSTAEISILRKTHFPSLALLEKEKYNFYYKKYHDYVVNLNSIEFSMIAFDYDGTLSGSDYDSRHSIKLDDNIRKYIISFLQNKIKVGIVSGRGGSIVDIFKNSIPEEYWHLLYLGHYNGMLIYPLNENVDLKFTEEVDLNSNLKILLELLEERCPFFEKKNGNNENVKKRKDQLTISEQSYPTIVYQCCKEIILEKKFDNINVWLSSHSMDVVVSDVADKRNIAHYTSDPILCIGDSGSITGNDFQLLSLPYSLSVNKVTYNPESCWNIAPNNCKEIEATLYYLRNIKCNEGKFRCNFKL